MSTLVYYAPSIRYSGEISIQIWQSRAAVGAIGRRRERQYGAVDKSAITMSHWTNPACGPDRNQTAPRSSLARRRGERSETSAKAGNGIGRIEPIWKTIALSPASAVHASVSRLLAARSRFIWFQP
jgi:hypothetical protein